MDKKYLIDDLFKSKLDGYSPEYVPEHWQMMKSALESSSKTGLKSSGNTVTNVLLIVSAIIIVCTGFYAYTLSEKLRTQYDKNQNISLCQNIDHQTASSIDKNRVTVNDNPTSQTVQQNDTKKLNAVNSVKQNANRSNSAIEKKNFVNGEKKTNNTSEKKNTKNSLAQNKDKDLKTSNTKAGSAVKTDQNFNSSVKTQIENDNVQKSNTTIAVINNENKVTDADNSVNENKNQTHNDVTIAIKRTDGLSEAELGLVPTENENYSSVTDDYFAKKQQLDARHMRKAENKAKNAAAIKKANMETAPDFKVSVVNNIVSNPAFSGFNQHHTIEISTLVHKPTYKPASDFTVPFEYGITYDFNFGKKNNYGLGINYKRFVGGAEGSLDVDLTFAYRFRLAKDHNLRVGVSATYVSSGVNFSDMTFPDMIDSKNGYVYNTNENQPAKSTKSNFDMGLGLWYTWKTLYVGISGVHLTSPNVGMISVSRIPREYTLSSGYSFKLNKNMDMLPAFEMNYDEHTFNFTPDMLFAYHKRFLFGVEFQNLKTAGLILGCNLNDSFILNLHGGVPMSKNLIDNFGIIDYAGLSLRFQFGETR